MHSDSKQTNKVETSNATSLITLIVCVMPIILPMHKILLQSINQQKSWHPQNQLETNSKYLNTSSIPLVAHLSLGSSLRSGSTCDSPARNLVVPNFSKMELEFPLTKSLFWVDSDFCGEILGIELVWRSESVDMAAIFEVSELCVRVF